MAVQNIQKSDVSILTLAVEQSSEGIAVVDLDYTLIYCNPAWAKMHGYTPAEVKGKSVTIFHAQQVERVGQIGQQLLSTGEFRGEVWHSHRDGRLFPTIMQNTLVRDAEGQPLAFVATVRDLSDMRAIEDKCQGHQKRLRALAAQLAMTEAGERRQVACYLHDQIGQLLAFCKMKMGSVLNSAKGQVRDGLRDIEALLDQALRETRELEFELYPPTLRNVPFGSAVRWLTEKLEREVGLKCCVDDDDTPKQLSQAQRVVLFRALREVLLNVAKHARTQEANLSIAVKDASMRIVVEDHGIGFDPAVTLGAVPRSFGLLSIKEQLGDLGGAVAVTSQLGKGTQVVIELPLEGSPA